MTTMGNGYPSPAILKAFRRKIDPKTGALVEDDGSPEPMPGTFLGSVANTGVIWVGEGASGDSGALAMPVCAHDWHDLPSYQSLPYERCRVCTTVRVKP